MIIQKAESVTCYDVDGTLVTRKPNCRGWSGMNVVNPYTGTVHLLHPLENHIELLKSHHAQGSYIKVWSSAGWEWALAVVKALKLEKYVHAVETKPNRLVDDLPVNEIFPTRIFIPELR